MRKSNIVKVMSVLLTALMILPNNFIFAEEGPTAKDTPTETTSAEVDSTETEQSEKADVKSEATAVEKSAEESVDEVEDKTVKTDKTKAREEVSTAKKATNSESQSTKTEVEKTSTDTTTKASPETAQNKARKEEKSKDSAESVDILYNIKPDPETDFYSSAVNEDEIEKQVGNPSIDKDHPQKPGEVMLFKELSPVEGKVNQTNVKLRLETVEPNEPTDIVFLIDVSGNLEGFGRELMLQDTNKFIDEFLTDKDMNTRISLVQFDTYRRNIVPLTNNKEKLKTALDEYEERSLKYADYRHPNVQYALKQAEAILDNSQAKNKLIILFSGGDAHASYRLKKSYLDTLTLDSAVKSGVISYNKEDNWYEFSENVPLDAFDYDGTDYDYSNPRNLGSYWLHQWETITTADGDRQDIYYNSLNSACAEAKHSKYDIYAFPCYAGKSGSKHLMRIADEGKFYKETGKRDYGGPRDRKNSLKNLLKMSKDIQDTIGTVQNENFEVTEQLKPGYEIVKTEKPSQGGRSETINNFNWWIGNLKDDEDHVIYVDSKDKEGKKLKIHYAEMSFTVRITDDFVPEKIEDYKDEAQLFDETYVEFTDYKGAECKKEFPDEKFDPVLYSMEAEVQDQFGKPVQKDQDLYVEIYGPEEDKIAGEIYKTKRVDSLNPKSAKTAKISFKPDLKFAGTYYIKESLKPEDYTVTYYLNGKALDSNQFTVQNGKDLQLKVVYTAKPNIKVRTNWQDNNNQDGVRPETVRVKLLANGKDTGKTLDLSEANKWSGTIKDLAETAKEATYSLEVVEPSELSAYKFEVTGNRQDGLELKGIRVKDLPVSVKWVDNDNQDGYRPESITINLLNGDDEVLKSFDTKAQDFQWSFKNLAKYDADGHEIDYKINNPIVPHYSTEVRKLDNGYVITNSHTPGKSIVEVMVNWDDDNNQDGKRPDELNYELIADDKETGKTITLNADNYWNNSFTDLDMRKSGKKVQYSVKLVSHLDASYDTVEATTIDKDFKLYEITNKRTPETITLDGTITWQDNNDKEGKRPDSVNIHLLKNGVKIDSLEVLASKDWHWSFKNLDKYEDGKEIIYSISQEKVDGYKASKEDGNITYTYQAEKPTEPSESSETEKPSKTDEPVESSKTSKKTDSSKATKASAKSTKKATSKTGERIGIYSIIGLSLLALGIVLAIIKKKYRKNTDQD